MNCGKILEFQDFKLQDYCHYCIRMFQERDLREREEQRRIDYEEDRREREQKLAYANSRMLYAEDYGYNFDTNAANYYFILNEDGSISWRCRPKDIYSEYEELGNLVKKGFLKRMSQYKFVGASFDYMMEQAYLVGANGYGSEDENDSFDIVYENNGFTFYLSCNPCIEFIIENNKIVNFNRVPIFDDKRLMDNYDKGMWEYINNNMDSLVPQALSIKEEKRIVRQKEEKQNSRRAFLTFFSFSIISAIVLYLWGSEHIIFPISICAIAALYEWHNHNKEYSYGDTVANIVWDFTVWLIVFVPLTKFFVWFFTL